MRIATLPSLALAAFLSTTPSTSAQSINLDIGDFFGTPSSSHAAGGQAGQWNSDTWPFSGTYFDVAGNPTTASLSVTGGFFNIAVDNAATSGEVQAFLDDALALDFFGNFTFSGLENGTYTVLTYCFAPDNDTWLTEVSLPASSDPAQVVGAPWSGSYVLGEQYAQHSVEVTNGQLVVDFLSTGGAGGATCNGFQLIKEEESLGQSFCVAGANSVSPEGSRMQATGSSSLADADLRLLADNAPDQPGVFYFGANQISQPFGDGFRCVSGSTNRLGVILGMGGQFEFTVDFGSTGAELAALGTVNFQCWYRDPAAGGSGFNLSDGLEIVFLP